MRKDILSLITAAAVVAGCGGYHGLSSVPQAVSGTNAVRGHAAENAYTAVALSSMSSGGNSINNRGWVAGFSAAAGSAVHAALWRGKKFIDLGTLGGTNSGVEYPIGNVRGLLAGISETSTADPLKENWSCSAFIPADGNTCVGFAWEHNKMTALPTLGGNNGFAAGANESGQIVGWAETAQHDSTCKKPQQLGFEAVVWAAGSHKAKPLAGVDADPDSAATAINDNGQIVGISGTCDTAVGALSAKHAVLWENGKAIDIGSLGGEAWNTPDAINENGEVAGFSDLPGDKHAVPNFHAFVWTKDGGMHDLGTLPGDVYSEALGINDQGVIVGVSYAAGFATSRAFIVIDGAMQPLQDLLAGKPTLSLLYANDINDRGEITGGACALKGKTCPKGAAATTFLATPSH